MIGRLKNEIWEPIIGIPSGVFIDNGWKIVVMSAQLCRKPTKADPCVVPVSLFEEWAPRCDYFVFVFLEFHEVGHIVGFISIGDFEKRSLLKRKGDLWVDGYPLPEDCFVLTSKHLGDPEKLRAKPMEQQL